MRELEEYFSSPYKSHLPAGRGAVGLFFLIDTLIFLLICSSSATNKRGREK